MPYVKEYEDGTLVGAISKTAADQMIGDLQERTVSSPVRKASRGTTDAYYRAVGKLRQAFVREEGREPTADDKNYTDALDELHEAFFPKSGSGPVKKESGEGPVAKALSGERVVMRTAEEMVKAAHSGGRLHAAMQGERVVVRDD